MIQPTPDIFRAAVCICCGCNDLQACLDEQTGQPCFWRRLDRAARVGVCSSCEEVVTDWDAGDRTVRVPIDLFAFEGL